MFNSRLHSDGNLLDRFIFGKWIHLIHPVSVKKFNSCPMHF